MGMRGPPRVLVQMRARPVKVPATENTRTMEMAAAGGIPAGTELRSPAGTMLPEVNAPRTDK